MVDRWSRGVAACVALLTALMVVPVASAAPAAATGPTADEPSSPLALPPAGGYQALSPARLLDTRSGGTTVDGAHAAGGAVTAGTTRNLPVAGRGGVPTTGVAAVALNVTVVSPTSAGYLTAAPHGPPLPVASNINYVAGQTVANLVVVAVGSDGTVDLNVQFGTTDVVADVAGWFPSGSDYTPVAPARLLDTRNGGSTIDGQQSGGGPVAANTTRNLVLEDRGGLPASGISAVVLNVTVDRPTSSGYLTLFPHGEALPVASNLNYVAGQTVANLVVVAVGSDGTVDLNVQFGTTNVITDVAGWFTEGASYTSFTPKRLLDTRTGQPTIDGQESGGGPILGAATRTLPVAGRGGIPATGVAAVVLNVTVDHPSAGGYLTVWPTGEPRPNASSVNFAAGTTVPNSVIAKVGAEGSIDLFNAFGSSPVIVDVAGWFPTASPTAVASGGAHTCAIAADRTVRCWGKGQYGALGNGAGIDANLPVTVKDLTTATAVTAGGTGFSCALLADHTVRCWGHNDRGQLGDGSTTDRYAPVQVSGITTALAVSAGESHACALLADDSIRCWGDDTAGQLGDGTSTGSPVTTPVAVQGIDDATSIAASYLKTCAVIGSGSVRCWGENWFGGLGDGTTTESWTPVTVQGIDTAVQVAGGTGHACALLADHTVRCWGFGANGRLGDGDTASSPTPVAVTGVDTAVAISARDGEGCALLADRTVTCWGRNSNGQIGDGTTSDAPTPLPVQGVSTAAGVSVGGAYACAVVVDRSLRCWGMNGSGQLGRGTTADSGVASTVLGFLPSPAIDVSTGYGHSCAVLTDHTIRCWGDNTSGQLGDGTTQDADAPVTVQGITTAVSVSAGGQGTCTVLADHTVRCWGANSNGTLGNGTTTDSARPVAVQGISTAVSVEIGSAHACALLTDQTVRCWGYNSSGELGNGTDGGGGYASSNVPVAVQGVSTAIALSVGWDHSCVVLTDQSARCWGGNLGGQLGTGSTSSSNAPVGVSGLGPVTTVAAGASHTCAVRAGGTAICWGTNTNGQLGDGTTISQATPFAETGVSATSVVAGSAHSCALLAGGTVRCWGDATDGQLGNGVKGLGQQSTTPVSVVGVTGATEVDVGGYHTCALLAGGTVRCWGWNFDGQLGNGTTTDSPVPVFVAGIG